jgi:hypothetical protein
MKPLGEELPDTAWKLLATKRPLAGPAGGRTGDGSRAFDGPFDWRGISSGRPERRRLPQRSGPGSVAGAGAEAAGGAGGTGALGWSALASAAAGGARGGSLTAEVGGEGDRGGTVAAGVDVEDGPFDNAPAAGATGAGSGWRGVRLPADNFAEAARETSSTSPSSTSSSSVSTSAGPTSL